MTITYGQRVCVRIPDTPDDGRIGIVVKISDWYGQPLATVLFFDASWYENDHDHFYVWELMHIGH